MTRKLMTTPKRSVSRYFVLITSVAPCAASLAPSASPGTPSPVGSKKEAALPELSETLAEPDPEEAVALELDELWSFVLKRANKRWIWVALCRATRQVVAYAVGDRSHATCRKLWAVIPSAYRRGHCFSDFWEAYRLVIPPSSTRPRARSPASPRTSSGGTTLCGSGLGASSGRVCHSPSPTRCTSCVCDSSCTITTLALSCG